MLASGVAAARPDEATEPRGYGPHSPTFESYSFQTPGRLDDEGLEDLLDQLPENVYRVKGLVRTNGDSAWTLVNAVAGRFEMEAFEPDPVPERSALVWIGMNIDRSDLESRCRALVLTN